MVDGGLQAGRSCLVVRFPLSFFPLPYCHYYFPATVVTVPITIYNIRICGAYHTILLYFIRPEYAHYFVSQNKRHFVPFLSTLYSSIQFIILYLCIICFGTLSLSSGCLSTKITTNIVEQYYIKTKSTHTHNNSYTIIRYICSHRAQLYIHKLRKIH